MHSSSSGSASSRRTFLAAATATVAATGATLSPAAQSPSDERTIRVGVMGLSRGMALARTFSRLPGVEVAWLCDVDPTRIKRAADSLREQVDYEIRTTADFEEILADDSVDALLCAAPNHWHAPAAVLACAAGKHVYVEKPCSHNPYEGELLVAASRKHGRCVQMGNQRRSSPSLQTAMNMLHEGRIGDVHYSRSWYANQRGTIGTGEPTDPPAGLDYDAWQGPAPRLPFVSNRLHYNWHWNWHFGNGELGNNGVHSIDLSRWGLQVEFPERVVSSGGRYWFADDQQTPDTHIVSFEFDDGRQIIWEGLSCNRHGLDGSQFGASFHGTDGALTLTSSGYTFFDRKGKPQETDKGSVGDAEHAQNFVTAIRNDDPESLNSEISEGHRSTLLCHLGNIAQRTGAALTCDSANGHILDNDQAAALWQREYSGDWLSRLQQAAGIGS